ncbi:MAG: hypothetical protein U5J83_07920 [Bryobacterales bacterium]|nr:hypothetical protein [Bryobacterales bacterium]
MSDQYHKPAGFEKSVEQGYEETDARVGFIAWAGVAIVVFLVVTVLSVQAYFDSVHEREEYVKVLEPVSEDYKNLRAREDAELFSYKFVDREKGIVRLPIQRAMDLVVAEAKAGTPAYPTARQPVKETFTVVPDSKTMGGVNDPASQALLAAAPK